MPSLTAETYKRILVRLPPTRESDSSVYTLINCSEASSLLRSVSTSPELWKPHYEIRYRHSNEHKEEERKSKNGYNLRGLYIERRKLESQALDTISKVIQGDTGSFHPPREEGDGPQVSWLQVVGRSIAQLGMDIYDLLDILQRTAPQTLRGAPKAAELEHEHPTSPWKSWAWYLKGLVLRHDAISGWLRMKDNPDQTTFERSLAGLSAFHGVSHVEVGGTNDVFCGLIPNLVDIDIRRSGFVGVRMSFCFRVFWGFYPREPLRDLPRRDCQDMREGVCIHGEQTLPSPPVRRCSTILRKTEYAYLTVLRTHRFQGPTRRSLPTPFHLRPGSSKGRPNVVGIRIRCDL